MKKHLLMALAALSLVACVQEEIVTAPKTSAITFDNAYLDNATRAAADPSTTTASIANFNVWGFMDTPDGTVFVAEDVQKAGSMWTYANTQYWAPNHKYYFTALSPMDSANWTLDASGANTDGAGVVSFTNVNGSEDLLYAATSVETLRYEDLVNDGMDPVKLQFNHLLSKVKFTFTNGFKTDNAFVEVKNIKMTSPKTGTLALNTTDWATGDKWDITGASQFELEFGNVAKLAMGTNDECTTERLSIPASAAYVYDITFDVILYMGTEVALETTKHSTVTGLALQMGKAYNFTAEINPENLALPAIEFEVEVKEWEQPIDVTTGDGAPLSADAAALQAAFNNGGYYALTGNVVLADTDALVIPADKNVVLDLYGYTISQEKAQTGAHNMIQNKGALVIRNTGGPTTRSNTVTGGIVYADIANLSAAVNYVSNVIQNSGRLTIYDGVSVVNNSSAGVATYGYPHAIDNSGELIIHGGTFTNNTNYASLRIWCTEDDDTKVTINGGTFNGSIDLQNVSAKPNKGTLVINGGTFNADTYTKSAVRLLGFGADVDEINAYLNGGTFNGEIARRNWSGAEFNSQVIYIYGGTYTTDASEFAAEGYSLAKKGDAYVAVEGEIDAVVSSKEDLPKDSNDKFDTTFEENVTLFDDITVSAGETNAGSGYGATGVKVVAGAVLDGQGNTLTVTNAGATWDCVVAVTGGTIKNLTVAGAMRGIFMPGASADVYIDNVIFKDVIYTFNSDAGNKNYGVYISNCVVNGWTSFSNAHKEVVFTNCTFGEGCGYAFCRPYNPCVFENCEFSQDFKFDTTKISGIVFKNCTHNGVKITAENAATLGGVDKNGNAVTFFYNGLNGASFE